MPRVKRLRSDRMVVVAAIVTLVLASVVYYVIQRGKLGDTRLASDKTLLAALAATMVVLALGLGWMTVRNLARVLAGRRRGIIGSRLQARVALSFLLLVLAPSMVLFWTAIAVVKQSIDQLATPAAEGALRDAARVPEWIYRDKQLSARHFAREVRDDLARGPLGRRPWPPRGEMARHLREVLQRYDLDAVGLIAPGESPLATARVVLDEGGAPSIRSSELTRVPPDVAAQALRSGQPQVLVERMAVGWRAVASEPILAGDDVQAVVWVALVVPERVERLLGQITATRDDLQELQARRVPVRRLYYALFTLITLLVLFASVWAGFFLARQVTRPIQELAKGTDALAQGDLSYRVRETGDDEIGRLGESFNHMADEIQRHRRDLVARRRYIETLLEAVPLGVLSIDPKGQVSTANRAALEVLGVDELRSGRPFAVELGEQREAIVATLGPVLRGERTSVMDEVKIGPKDAEVSVEVRARRFALPARGEGVLVVLEDMTRLRRAERLAAWAEVAQRVAHEIKNPLTPIRLSAERMVRRYRKDPDGFGEVLKDGVDTIVREVEMLRSLVAEFSRFARMPHVRLEEGDVRITVDNAVALYRDVPERATVRAELAPALPQHRFDEEAMRRCLINLIDNAVAVSEDGAPVVVRVQAGPRHESVRIEVEDHGPGIPEEDRARIFDPRFSRRAGGTGLGLSIVYQIVADHGGHIRVEPNPRRGTRFVIELPAVPERADEIITDVREGADAGEAAGGATGDASEDGDVPNEATGDERGAASAAAKQAGKDGER